MVSPIFAQLPTATYVAGLLDVVAYPFTGPMDDHSVDGLFINRFNPTDLFGLNIGYCRTNTHKGQFAAVDGVDNISACHIGTRDKDGNILGFIDNEPIEFVHKFTHDRKGTQGMGMQFFDTMRVPFGDYLYYARGSGIFFNPGKVLNARNKIDAMRIGLNNSKMTPTVKGWNDSPTAKRGDLSKTPNQFFGKDQ